MLAGHALSGYPQQWATTALIRGRKTAMSSASQQLLRPVQIAHLWYAQVYVQPCVQLGPSKVLLTVSDHVHVHAARGHCCGISAVQSTSRQL